MSSSETACGTAHTALLAEDSPAIRAMVVEGLDDEGYAVSVLPDCRRASVQATVERRRPDCALLAGEVPGRFWKSWTDAASMSAQGHTVPVIMFSADQWAVQQAQQQERERSQSAGIVAVLSKPFNLDELVELVALAVKPRSFLNGQEAGHP